MKTNKPSVLHFVPILVSGQGQVAEERRKKKTEDHNKT